MCYFWESVRKDVIEHVGECVPCKLRKVYQGRPLILVMKYPRVSRQVHMDLPGPLVKTKRGHQLILVVKDHLTKFVWLFPIRSKKAEEIAQQLVDKVFSTFGIPRDFHSDKGTEFVNQLVAKISHIFRVQRISTTPYNPRSNGFVENYIKILKDQLFHFVGVLQED